MKEFHKIEFPEIGIIFELMNLIKRIYQHEQTPRIVKKYIEFECSKFFKEELKIREFLKAK